jgi:sugar phosphate isomerase/epimerase
MIPIALSTGSLHTYGIARVFDLAGEAGFDAVEVLMDRRWDTRQPAYLNQLSRSTGLPIAAVHSPFMPFVPGWPFEPLERLRLAAAVAREVGAEVVVTHLPLRIWLARLEIVGQQAGLKQFPIPLPARSAFRRFLLDGLAAFEASEKVTVGVENMPVKRLLGRPLEVYLLNRPEELAGLPHLTLDTTHLGTKGLDPLAIYQRLRGLVVHVHLSNFNGQEHRLPHDGHLALKRFLQALAHDRYPGAVSLEVGPDVLHAEDATQVRANLCQALDFCRENTTLP